MDIQLSEAIEVLLVAKSLAVGSIGAVTVEL